MHPLATLQPVTTQESLLFQSTNFVEAGLAGMGLALVIWGTARWLGRKKRPIGGSYLTWQWLFVAGGCLLALGIALHALYPDPCF